MFLKKIRRTLQQTEAPQFIYISLVIILSFLLIGSLYMSGQKVYSQSPITPPVTPPDATPTPTPEPGNDSTSTSSTSSGEAPTCSDPAPSNEPELFQIDVNSNSATLYFTPANDHVSYYFVAFGYNQGDLRFGSSFTLGPYNGVISYQANHLSPNTEYYFAVRAGNGCATGKWSNWLRVKTTSNKGSKQSFYLYN
ncbi:fibronectin type III domain-containing protein [Candidatus Microgenomates bacterium]|nr:fibronectin type III domain-containing protein [Candidatus Microgenomates bacterium]